jgi:hypothetical protein
MKAIVVAIAASLALASTAQAELLRVEVKTLGMDWIERPVPTPCAWLCRRSMEFNLFR